MSDAADTHLAALVASRAPVHDGVTFRLSEDHWSDLASFVTDVGKDAAVEAARRWLTSDDTEARCVGFDVLDYLALNDKTIWPLVLTEARRAADDGSREIRDAAASALRYVVSAEALPLWLRFAADPEAQVRWHAVSHLSDLFGETNGDHRILSTLIAALEDPDPDIRDWAAFGLGTQLALDDDIVDTPELRDALARHLDDDGADTAGEAAVGLARRGDDRVLPVLLERLAHDDVGNLYVEAARDLGDPRLLPLLDQLLENGWKDDEPPNRARLLDEAIERCRRTVG